MIKLTRLDGSPVFINEHVIQWIECLPDTTITLLNGARVLVREKLEEVFAAIDERLKYERKIADDDCASPALQIGDLASDNPP